MTSWTGHKVTKARATWTQRLPLPCYQCKRPVYPGTAWVVEHMTPRSQGGTLGPENQWVSHRHCSDRSGGRMAAAITNTRRRPPDTQLPTMTPSAERRIRPR